MAKSHKKSAGQKPAGNDRDSSKKLASLASSGFLATLADAVGVLKSVADESLAESWDKVGLHAGDLEQRVTRGLLCIDLTEAVVAEAVEQGCELVVAYHPPIFGPLTSLTNTTWKQRALLEAVRAGLAIYSPHTALDATVGGVNDWLVDGLVKENELATRRPIAIAKAALGGSDTRHDNYKVVVFALAEDVDRLREAMSCAGAGRIGLTGDDVWGVGCGGGGGGDRVKYSECSFTAAGEGTFRGDADASPHVGKPGRLERTPEVRLEMIAHRSCLTEVLAAAREVHPYEEPAIDVVALVDEAHFIREVLKEAMPGAGRLVTLKKAIRLSEASQRLQKLLKVKHLEVGQGLGNATIRSIAVCPGAGGSLFETCPSADLYVTGEMRHHDVLDLVQQGKHVLLAGHTQTERPYLATYANRLRAVARQTGFTLDWAVSKHDQAASAMQ